MDTNINNNPLKILNLTVLLQQQRYIIPVLFLFYLQNGLTLADFLFFQSIFYFTGLFAEIPAGYIGDIFPRKYVLIFSYSLFMVRIILWLLCPNYYTILLGEVLYGLSKAFYRGVSDGYIYDYLKLNKIPETMCKNYGKFNFFMSTGSAVSCLLSAWLFQYFGSKLLLAGELVCNTLAIIMLFSLPKLPQYSRHIKFKLHIKRIILISKKTITNSKIITYMLYSGILTGITSLFVWNFQPFMKSCGVPVVLFGAIYFINHMLRAAGSLKAELFVKKITLEKTGLIVWLLYLLCFIILLNTLDYHNLYLCISTLLFICVAIGIQMVFNIASIARIHGIISSTSRATMSSVNSMFSGLFSGLFLMIFKFLVEYQSQKTAILIFTIYFIPSILLVKKLMQYKN